MTFQEDSHLDIFSSNTNICRLSILGAGGEGEEHDKIFQRVVGEGIREGPYQQVCINQSIDTCTVCKIQYILIVKSTKFEVNLTS